MSTPIPPNGWPPPPYTGHPLPHDYPQPAAAQPPGKPHWWRDLGTGAQVTVVLTAVMVGAILIGFIASALTGQLSSPREDITVSVQSCEFTGEMLPSATVQYTVTNAGQRSHQVKIHWEYRDAGGARVDAETSRVTVPARDTIRSSETTMLPVAVHSGTCRYRIG